MYSDWRRDDRVLAHLELIWDSAGESEEFYESYLELLRKTTGLEIEPGQRRVRWTLDRDHGYARMEGLGFTMVVATDAGSLKKVLSPMSKPPALSRSLSRLH